MMVDHLDPGRWTGRSEREIRRAITASELPVRWGRRALIHSAELQRRATTCSRAKQEGWRE